MYAELSADGRRFVLLATGTPDEMTHAGHLLSRCTPLFSEAGEGALWCPATWGAAVQLSAAFGDGWHPSPRLIEWIKAETLKRSHQLTSLDSSSEPLAFRLPEGLKPYSWQLLGAHLIARLGSAFLMDDAGTGKTMTAILGLVQRASTTMLPLVPGLVVCPASVVDPWVEAWQTWAPHVRVLPWRGDKQRRIRLIGKADVYVASWDIIRSDAGPATAGRHRPLITLDPGFVVLDEVHKMKNGQALQTKAARRLAHLAHAKTGTVIAMSGTPIAKSPFDAWPALDALEPGAWPAGERWKERYCVEYGAEYGVEQISLDAKMDPEFRLSLLGQVRRVAKADAMPELPPKIHSVRTVELPPKARAAYDSMESDMLTELDSGEELSIMWVMAQVGLLTQMASATAADVEITYGPDTDELGEPKRHQHVILSAPSWKVDALLEIMAERPGEPIVAFGASRQLMMIAGEQATKAGHRVGYIVGGQTPKQRTENVKAFQAGELDLICVTTAAGGTGITLTRSACAVFLQRPWSMIDALQAEDRLHRIGAQGHESIDIIDIVAKATVDTRIRDVLRGKAGQLAELVQDPRVVHELFGGK